MHRRQGDGRQSGTASLRPAWWLVLLVGAATAGAWLSVETEAAAPQQAAAPVTVAIQFHGGAGGKGMSGAVTVGERTP